VPQGSAIEYDPEYGLGYRQPRWKAFFNTAKDMPHKLQVAGSSWVKSGDQPTFISVQYANAHYRISQ
jgi:hypothetical protein